MKTTMNRLITIKSISLLALVLLVALGPVFADDDEIGAEEPAPSLTGTTEHNFVGHLGTIDDEGRLLAWEGTIGGDINGVIQWWMGPMSTIGHISNYVYRVEIWNSDKTVLLLAGEAAGSTTAAPGKDGFWRGKGIVTQASAEFENWIGRQVFESGQATWAIPGVLPDHGVSTFLIPLVVDFNGDGKVDNTDINIMAGYWNTGDPVCDIGPTPLGDGIVDAQDLLVLTEYLTKPDVEADIAAIKELYNQATLACSTGDAELYVSMFTEDAVVMPPGYPATMGKEELRPMIEGLFGLFDLELPYTVEEVEVIGNRAFVRSSWQYSMTPKEGGDTTTSPGKQLDNLKRQSDGSWKIYIQCYNYNEPQ
ncbi:MAG: SgcJ/EcaC family oxidoreductase [Planctomycetota bacterium]|jgi:uncharacterized protein (TIGR02246 family)